MALGGDPVNMVDPSGGWSNLANGLSKSLEISRLGVAAITTFLGAVAGAAITRSSSDDGKKGALVGAFLGLASNFSGSIGMAVFQGVVGVGNEVIKKKLEQMPVATPLPAGVSSTGVIGKSIEPTIGKIGEFKNNFPTTLEQELIRLVGFKEHSSQPDPRLQLVEKASNWDRLFEIDLAGYNYLGEKLYHAGKGAYSLKSYMTSGVINLPSFKTASIFIKGFGLINKLKFHRVIKLDILKEARKIGVVFEHIVGKNPDIVVKGGKILLQGAKDSPFAGKIIETFIDASKFLK